MQKLNIKCKPVENGGPKSPTKNVRIISYSIIAIKYRLQLF